MCMNAQSEPTEMTFKTILDLAGQCGLTPYIAKRAMLATLNAVREPSQKMEEAYDDGWGSDIGAAWRALIDFKKAEIENVQI